MNITAEGQSCSTHEDTAQIFLSYNHVSLRNVFSKDACLIQRISLCSSNFPLYFQFRKQFWLPWRAIFCCFSCKVAVSSDTGIQESNPTGLLNKVEDSSAEGKNGHKFRYNHFGNSVVSSDYLKIFKWVVYNAKIHHRIIES